MAGKRRAVTTVSAYFLVIACYCAYLAESQILNPPYFNLAEGRKIWATATCGEGVSEPELYCKLVGATVDFQDNPNINLIQGQVCDYCDPNDPKTNHPAEFAIDGTERWWQSPPLSRGNKFNAVNLTIDLGQEFHVAYVFVKMANSPRPGVWILERSKDNGKTYQPWQYFADNPSECYSHFGPQATQAITTDDSVICETKHSKVVPLQGGEIVISLLNERPSADNFSHSIVLQEWTKATNVRLRLLRTKNLLGHLMSVARQDPTVTRRYFYSIKDINIGGRCVCNGHADTCDIIDPNDPYKLLCVCQHNTCGAQCEQCCPRFVQKKWRAAEIDSRNECESCNCFGHSEDCLYDEKVDEQRLSLDFHGRYDGGGVCNNCRDNTEGVNCNKCRSGYFRPYGKPLNVTDVCHPCRCDLSYSTGNCAEGSGQCECRPEFLPPYCDKCNYGYYDYPLCKPCDCNFNGTIGPECEVGGGQCPCKPSYTGKNCDQCAEGYFGFPDCRSCDCNAIGSFDVRCEIGTGQCPCRNSFGGRSCDRCDVGFYNYPLCQFCLCDSIGSTEQICNNVTGSCLCRSGYGGARCDQCAPGFFGYPKCVECGCNDQGSSGSACDSTGRCRCLPNFSGMKCNQCSPGYYKYPDCLACNCDPSGAHGISCDWEGRCSCRPTFDGEKCDKCREGFYNYPLCEECNCNPAGVLATFVGCGSLTSGELCECKERVTGRICNQCKPLYWNLRSNNPQGCEDCDCHTPGTMGGLKVCEGVTGQCTCKPNVVSRQCHDCRAGTYSLQEENLFGCVDCGCDIGGAVSNICDRETGQCVCRPRINGRQCNKPLQTHYFPTLHHLIYEVEDGRTATSQYVRFGFDHNIFPHFSWRGYAIFSDIQKEIMMDIYIDKPSLYHVLLRYLNFGGENVYGVITFMPETFGDTQQSSDMVFEPTREPKFMRVSGKQGLVASAFVLNPGRWIVSIRIERPLFMDYMVLLPQTYYEATLLQDDVSNPCHVGQTSGLCKHYFYPTLPSEGAVVRGEAGYATDSDERTQTQIYSNETVLEEIGTKEMAWLNEDQNAVKLDLRLKKTGKYVLVVLYHTPEGGRTTKLLVDVSTSDRMSKGKSFIYNCNYSFLCRQVVTDRQNQIAVFDLESSFVSVTLSAEDNVALAVDQVAAIPLEKWHMDYSMPQVHCIRKDGQCQEMQFPRVSEAAKVDFAIGFNEDRISEELPPTIQDKEVKLIYLDHKDAMVDVQGSVQQSGYYVFIVHYYQPHHPAFDMDVLIQNGQFYEAKLPLSHCPSSAGCRAVILDKETNGKEFQILENFVLTLKEPNHKSVWVDYVLAVLLEGYDDSLLHLQKLDKAVEFITKCGQNNFYIPTTSEGFCRDAVYSLTAEYNNGALACQCDIEGSLSFECEEFGGQCQCRPNVIGRACSQCKTGFFGFPNCKDCDCPSTAVCHPVTGQCICPPRVTGEKCDTCVPFTYGLDPIIGCEECNCNPLGVNGNLQCNVDTGQCQCKSNVVDRACDKCVAGYWAFPRCHLCNCDLRGTTEGICDQQSSQCYCKENVYGEYCDQCKPGTFFLEEGNPLGCTKCFCFGTTARCASAYLVRTQVIDQDGWEVQGLHLNSELEEVALDLNVEILGATLRVRSPDELPSGTMFYFVAPETYLGKKLTAYGGFLSYGIVTMASEDDSSVGLTSPDIILTGNNFTIVHNHLEQPAINHPLKIRVRLVEREFRHLTGSQVSREQLMMVLVNLDGIYLRGSYFHPATDVRITDVLLDTAEEGFVTQESQAVRVEQCQCPANYKGFSCEECAPGYFRAKTGPYLGFCVPCSCHGHADRCDVNTGKCFDCQHNTVGDHCEMCAGGYHGNATQGTPFDCLICACPLPIETNNFAISCEVSRSGLEISCNCKPGYYGPRCEVCAAGYYGEPELPGASCNPCQCSGNIDKDQRGSCDSITGECVMCLHNTSGSACELCAPGFYGDAIHQKNCKQCDCDFCGTQQCDGNVGLCECRQNIVGSRCDQCEEGHWGFDSCYGCRPCNCGPASEDDRCNVSTGQCRCRDGATGLTCDVCEPGYWQYSTAGCVSCNCGLKYSAGVGCDPLTGQCQCLTGVIGEKCDSCPHRWVFLERQGCQECGPCVHPLLDDTDRLHSILNPIVLELAEVSGSYFAYRRLEYVNTTVDKIRPEVDNLMNQESTSVSLVPLDEDVELLKEDTNKMAKRASHLSDQADRQAHQSDDTRKEALEVEKLVQDTVKKCQDVVHDIQKLAEALILTAGPNIDRLIGEAERILAEVAQRNFSYEKGQSYDSRESANSLLEEVSNFREPALLNREVVKGLHDRLELLKKLLAELNIHSRNSLLVAQDTFGMIDTAKNIPVTAIVKSVQEFADMTGKTLDEASDLLEQAKAFFGDAKTAYDGLGYDSAALGSRIEDMRDQIGQMKEGINDVSPLVEDAKVHAINLMEQAAILDRLLSDTRHSADAAIQAANAYKNIVDAINNALQAAENALQAAEEARPMSEGMQEEATDSKSRSADLLIKSQQLFDQVNGDFRLQLTGAREGILFVESQNKRATKGLVNIANELEKLPKAGSIETAAKLAVTSSEDALNIAEEAQNKIQDILEKLPDELERAMNMPRDSDDINEAIKAGHNYVDRVSSILPNISSLVDKVGHKYLGKAQIAGADISAKIAELKHKVALARDQANRIKVGVSFYANTTLQLRNPESLSRAATYTQMSMYFRTRQQNGLLAYIGNEVGTHQRLKRTTTDDYMALEVRDGHLALVMDLGSGAEQIVNNRYVSDSQWHQVIIDRTGQTATITVRSEILAYDDTGTMSSTGEIETETVAGILSGTYGVFNLDQQLSQFFIGGVPDTVDLQEDVRNRRFIGCIEELEFGKTPVGLWNWVHAENNRQGCVERDTLTILEPTNGMRFDGTGYAILPRGRHNFGREVFFTMKFKTYSSDALLFLVGKDQSYFGAELRDGTVSLKYDFGSGSASIRSPLTYNDGQWHSLEVSRENKQAFIKMDGIQVAEGESFGREDLLQTTDNIYIGGYPGRHGYRELTNAGFEGCIMDVQIAAKLTNLNNNKEALGVTSGCPQMIARTVSFGNETPAYIAMPGVDLGQYARFTFKFKTTEPDGLLFYAANDDQSNYLSISLTGGSLVMRSEPGGEVRTSPENRYDDREWHYVTATKAGREMRLFIDDIDSAESEIAVLPTASTSSSLYFGGVPSNYRIKEDAAPATNNFVGCIGDTTVNTQFQNFADTQDRVGISLASCPLADLVTSPPPFTTDFPDFETTTKDEQIFITDIDFTPELTTPATTEPLPLDYCVLPQRPLEDPTVPPEYGHRFGSTHNSRQEYALSGNTIAALTDSSIISLEFKTLQSDGILAYVSGTSHIDFIGLFLNQTKITYSFNCGSGTATITTRKSFNDEKWHRVIFSRTGKSGLLQIDGDEMEGDSAGATSSMNVRSPLYVGGLSSSAVSAAKLNLKSVTTSFPGCIRGLEVQNEELNFPQATFNASPCSEYVEEGTFFSGGGYISLYDKYKVGKKLTLTLNIRPRSTSGVLIAAHGGTDYLILQMVDGDVLFSVENGKGPSVATVTLPNKYYLCDGRWHEIRAVKTNNVVTLAVDEQYTAAQYGVSGVTSTDTNSPLYVGGVPDPSTANGVETMEQYVGCLRVSELGQKSVKLSVARTFGHVILNHCPTI